MLGVVPKPLCDSSIQLLVAGVHFPHVSRGALGSEDPLGDDMLGVAVRVVVVISVVKPVRLLVKRNSVDVGGHGDGAHALGVLADSS